jgi:hypothetical protein
MLGGTILGVLRWRRAPDVTGILIRVEDGELVIAPRGSKSVLVRARLTELADVTLDTKSIRKVEPGKDVAIGTQFIDTQVGPEIDVARIVLHVEGRAEPVRLTEAFLAHMDSIAWAGKIRSFLRSHGWTPENERAAPEGEPSAEEEDAAEDEGGEEPRTSPRVPRA